MNILMAHINSYLESKSPTWTEATYKSEKSRLITLRHLLNMEPIEALKVLRAQGKKPYTIKTAFIRFSNFMEWAIQEGIIEGRNEFKYFLTSNKQVFRNAYNSKELSTDYGAALKAIEGRIPQKSCRDAALFLLKTGLRISELYKLKVGEDGNIYVIGKGGKRRRVFATTLPTELPSKSAIGSALSKIGLKPHDLRKLYATELLRNNIDLPTLCKVMGWSNIQTAMKYLQADSGDQLQARLEEII